MKDRRRGGISESQIRNVFRVRSTGSRLGWLILTAELVIGVTACSNAAVPQDLSSERQTAAEALRSGDCERAIVALNYVVNADRADVNSLRARASCYLKQQRFTSAIADYVRIAGINESADAFIDLAYAEWSAGQAAPARSALRKASSLASDEQTILRIAEMQNSYDDLAAARSTLSMVAVGDRGFRWFLELGKIDAAQAEPAAFESDFLKALKLAPTESQAGVLIALGDVRWNRTEYRGALDSYRRALATHGEIDLVHVYGQMADCDVNLGQFDAALTDYRAALDAGPQDGIYENLNIGLAMVLVKLHRNQEALQVLQQLLSDPSVSADTALHAKAIQHAISAQK